MTKHYLRPIWVSVCLAFLLIGANSEIAAQPVPILGYAANKNTDPKRLDAFKRGLTELGYSEGKNIRIDYREGVLDADYQQLMTEFVAAKVKIILAANAPAAVAAGRATSTIPIVLLAVNDPVGLGLVKSLERPDTNVTGTTMYAPQLIGERLRILKTIIPDLDKIAMVMNGNNLNNASQVELVRSEARGLGIEVLALDLQKPEEVEPAFDRAMTFGAKAFVNGVDSFINSRRFALAAQAEKHKLPAIYTDTEYVVAGGLMALGPGHLEGYYGAAKYVDKFFVAPTHETCRLPGRPSSRSPSAAQRLQNLDSSYLLTLRPE